MNRSLANSSAFVTLQRSEAAQITAAWETRQGREARTVGLLRIYHYMTHKQHTSEHIIFGF
ncbi:hypothetical protein EXIGUO9Y_360035 [Exiguobacterium oxidotolerans]|uniref:Uncharacterized protein n=1 Tax=Exiguobacterium oxidotolerans TaxID=223958 RepID=A0A653IES9_9BACL|nr:hypothetical protein EXIGUO9Y_360035 [Exiguobacterium oxidotolerans]